MAVSHKQLAAGDGVPGPDQTDIAPSAAPQCRGHSPHQPVHLLAAAAFAAAAAVAAAAGTDPGCGNASGDTWEGVAGSLSKESQNAAVGMKNLEHAFVAELG